MPYNSLLIIRLFTQIKQSKKKRYMNENVVVYHALEINLLTNENKIKYMQQFPCK